MKALMLPPERQGFPAPAQLAAIRQHIAGAAASPGTSEERIGGVRCLRIAPPGGSRVTMLHFHGGGYRMGMPENAAAYAAALSAACNMEIILPAYRLAPEHPFPCALHDALAVASAVAPVKLVLAGDSAGGGLAAALTRLCIARGLPLAGLVLHSPWLDLSLASASYRSNAATDPLFSFASASVAAELYLQGVSPESPLASPLFGDVAGFPASLISVGSGEVLVGDSRALHAALGHAGIRSELLEFRGMEHVAVTRDRALPGAAEVFAATREFLNRVAA